ncbi:hypothetical protein NDU88_006378 [Pleurodeles waltl]|uniref:Uncharacterized protein n=1 Tax=Pleurodeles waltl TaxID=8319 RepID=A0AAV7WE91_PLEWA|nr:hypothetical protein NDU88_006378 [Pleurodeles waltl]
MQICLTHRQAQAAQAAQEAAWQHSNSDSPASHHILAIWPTHGTVPQLTDMGRYKRSAVDSRQSVARLVGATSRPAPRISGAWPDRWARWPSLCEALPGPGPFIRIFPHLTVLAGASLVNPARKSPWAAFGGSAAAQGGRADAEARDCIRRCVAGSGAVQDAERAGGRGGPRRLLEVCGRVRSRARGLFGDAVVSQPCGALDRGDAAEEEAPLGPVIHRGPGGFNWQGGGPNGGKLPR